MRIFFFFGVLLLIGCAKSSEFCNFDLSRNDWSKISSPPDFIHNGKNLTWFANASGYFLACPELVGEYVCGNVYELYEKTGGGYEYKEIVCME